MNRLLSNHPRSLSLAAAATLTLLTALAAAGVLS
jgi:hypothetical protein